MLKQDSGCPCQHTNKRKRNQEWGGFQGKADIPALYILISSILLEPHKSIAPELFLQSYTRERAIKHNNVAYSDDTDGHVSANHDSDSPLESVIGDMRESEKNGITEH